VEKILSAGAAPHEDGDPLPFENSLQHILAELERIDLLVEAHVHRARRMHKNDEFQGLYISEQDIDALLARPIGLPSWAVAFRIGEDSELATGLATMRALIDRRARAALALGIDLRLPNLALGFNLSSFDVDAILICLAAHLDLGYEKLYAYLQDDVTRRHPSVDLVQNLVCASLDEKLDARARFSPNAPLLKYQLITLVEEPDRAKGSLLNCYLNLDRRISNYLLGQDEIDSRLARNVTLVEPAASLQDMILPSDLFRRLQELFENHRGGQRLSFYFQGRYGVGKRSAAGALCRAEGLRLLVVDCEHLVPDPAELDATARLILREAKLHRAGLFCHNVDALLTSNPRTSLISLLKELQDRQRPVFLAGEIAWEPSDAPDLPPFVRIEFPPPAYPGRMLFWGRFLDDAVVGDIDTAGLANKFRFTGGQIRDAVFTARGLARARDPHNPFPNMLDLLEACRLQSNRKLAALATRMVPRYTWADIVLPHDKMRQLREIRNAVEYRSIVYDQWGFDDKLSMGKGLSLLFAGPSGTGKTMAAEVMACELGLDLYKIDLSTVISKYIGETEKNLARIFAEAATSNAILFFDEADALFGKRSEVRDSHDRYANIEINYLLQRMEEYEGTVILATNLRKNMDDAFVRRIQFTIEFPFPNFEQRLAIWQKVWPHGAPRQDLDLEFMARRFEMSGGNIRNIALAAAFLGAEDGGCVRMKHLIRATWQEYQKMGKVVMEGEFGEYRDLSQPSD
jgi:DNA replication protein DnaC